MYRLDDEHRIWLSRGAFQLCGPGDEILYAVPLEEFTAYSALRSEARHAWLEAKQKSDFSILQPFLEKIIAHNRRVAALVSPDMDPYDYWLDEYERGLSTEKLDVFFNKVRSSLVPLMKRVTSSALIS